MIEHQFQCPYCWEGITMLLDPSASQTYVEDCEVCCNPITVTTVFENGELLSFTSENLGQ